MSAHSIVDVQYEAPPTWAPIPVDPDVRGWESEVVSMLVADDVTEELRSGLVEQLRYTHAILTAQQWGALGVWVPQPSLPRAVGYVALRRLLPGDSDSRVTPENYTRVRAAQDMAGVRVRTQEVTEGECPAGPLVMTMEVLEHPTKEDENEYVVEFHLVYAVFPPGSSEAVELDFCTSALAMTDEFAQDANAMMGSLDVQLG